MRLQGPFKAVENLSDFHTMRRKIPSPFERVRNGAVLLIVAVIAGTIGFHLLGEYGWLEALWMVVITVTTVGFGESSQSTPAVQVLTILLILVGMTAAVYTSTAFFQLVLEGELERTMGFRRMTRQIEKLKNHTIICGLGKSGRSLAVDLVRRGREIVIVEQDDDKLQEAGELNCMVVDGDATQEATLLRAGVDRASSLVISLPSDADNVFITLTARELNPEVMIVARARQDHTAKKLRQAGAQKVVMPAAVSAQLMSRMVLDPSAADWLELIAESSYKELDIEELVLADFPRLVGKTLQAAEAQRKHRILVVAIRDGVGAIVANPTADYVFKHEDVAVLMGNPSNITQFRQLYQDK
jgi:voltage-gated potassium channel